MTKRIAFQGQLGAYSHQACHDTCPDLDPLACETFDDAIAAVTRGDADFAMLPVENSTYGRVADIHRLLPESGLSIIGEAFVRVHISLMGIPGAQLDQIKTATSHLVLIPQCREFLKTHNIRAITGGDTAGSARDIAALKDPTAAALAAPLAAEIYGLDILAHQIEDNQHNTTRFLLTAPAPDMTRRGETGMLTSFIFQVRNIPAALYKAMGGFATNGVNMIKLESYMLEGSFRATQFYADIEGHPDDPNVARALEELEYFTKELRILGTYPADPRRSQL